MTDAEMQALRGAAEKATPGPWHHVQAFRTAPAVRTVHGPVPAQRIDYVSTWPDFGTPKGHRVIIDMPGRESRVSSDDMAYIALANPAAVLALLDRVATMRDALETIARRNFNCAVHQHGMAAAELAHETLNAASFTQETQR